jgi:hypothetical protein
MLEIGPSHMALTFAWVVHPSPWESSVQGVRMAIKSKSGSPVILL